MDGQTIRAALVGFTGRPDREDMERVMAWIERNDGAMAERNLDGDVINLNNRPSRDFLEEDWTYDIVVLLWLFDPEGLWPRPTRGVYNYSTRHKRLNWVKRLYRSGAKYIFAFGEQGIVSGLFLGQLPGYTKVYFEDYRLTVYRLSESPRAPVG
jgi:hypothetical protein